MKTLVLSSVALVAVLGWGAEAEAVKLIGNLPVNNRSYANVSSEFPMAAGFRLPPGSDYSLESAIFRLRLPTLSTPMVTLWTEGGNNRPDTMISTLIDQTPPSTIFQDHCFVPPSRTVLESSTTYWLGITTDSTSRSRWGRNDPMTFPTGIATYAGHCYWFDGWLRANTGLAYGFEVRAQVVPEPSTLVLLNLGLACLLLYARRRKRNAGPLKRKKGHSTFPEK